ncbi:DUF938 domain-containing protein [Mastigocoleus sp. MO_188.B34]|uniref:DUF938 domain-containing protein n=1 Tax=Mastigocoleus sp. MO_188.B34 TaxID=3036635 RepID=UPI00263562BA|nr:DUF938 domain-containing protein [Mastigocoleus sp. MO_188.B34]MDJ0695673.1 DUF938 domain-containing protein [Mastigocoleus sp. MO_188.B34]
MKKSSDARLYAYATQRNRQPILEVLLQVLPPNGTVLEIASGTGEHAVFFAPQLNKHKWLTSEPNPQLRASINAWYQHNPTDNFYPPLNIDARDPVWSAETQIDPDLLPIIAIVNINMIHISDWSACLGLMAGASRILPAEGILYLYGPFKQGGKHTAPSNEAFDRNLKMQNPDWGVRDLEDTIAAANEQNLKLKKIYQMPANNISVIFERCK